MRPDVRPQARKNRRCIRWNTLRIFSGRERRRWLRIVRRSRKVNVGQAPRLEVQQYWSWREELNLQPAVYKTAALPLSYASQNEMGMQNLTQRPKT